MLAKSIIVFSLATSAMAAQRIAARQPAKLFARQTFISCAEQGLPWCDDEFSCVKLGSTCCDFGGACPSGTFCDTPTAGEGGEPGCCPDGEDCNIGGGPGGTNTNIIISTRTNTNTDTPAPEPTTSEEPEPTYAPEPTSSSEPQEPTYTPEPTSIVETPTYSVSIPIGTGTSSVTPSSNGTAPTATAQPPAFTGAAVHGAVPAMMVVGAAVAALFV